MDSPIFSVMEAGIKMSITTNVYTKLSILFIAVFIASCSAPDSPEYDSTNSKISTPVPLRITQSRMIDRSTLTVDVSINGASVDAIDNGDGTRSASLVLSSGSSFQVVVEWRAATGFGSSVVIAQSTTNYDSLSSDRDIDISDYDYNIDDDRDGQTNFQEIEAGSDPLDGGSVPRGNADDLQGNWVSACMANNADNESEDLRLEVSGNSIIISDITYISSVACDGGFTISYNSFYTFSLTGEVTALAAGDAKHIDYAFTRASITASQGSLDALAVQGTTLEETLAEGGLQVEDLNNITAAEIGLTQLFRYDIYRVDPKSDGGMELRVGEDDGFGTLDGTSSALRPVTLDRDIRYDKVN